METLKRFDDYLFDAPFGFQNITNWIEYLLSLRYYTQVRVIILVHIAFYLNLNFTRILAAENLAWPIVVIFGVLVAVQVVFAGMLWLLTVIAKSNTDRGHRNPWRYSPGMLMVRTMFILFLVISFVRIFLTGELRPYEVLYDTFAVIVFYLLACEEAPPLQDTATSY